MPTIDGKSELVVPPVTLTGEVLRMSGKGVQNPRTGHRGSQLVTIRWVCPLWWVVHCSSTPTGACSCILYSLCCCPLLCAFCRVVKPSKLTAKQQQLLREFAEEEGVR